MSNLTKENFENMISNGMSLVDFWAEWCGYCRMLTPVIEEFQSKHGGEIKVIKINVDSERELAGLYGVNTLPTLVVFKDGEEIDRKMGFQPIEVLEEMTDRPERNA
ncbi:MAG: thioredoxin [Oscillospiraceae bacterium]|nr:thioredoxin [Oscillospiraceae bacterium]